MRTILLVFTICVANSGCTEQQREVETRKDLQPSFNLQLLNGEWHRINDSEDEKTYEIWEVEAENVKGIGFTLVNKDTIFKEILAIVEKDRDRFYDVRGVNPEPTLFKFTDHTESTFVCVNDSNEFPKRIEYCVFQDSMVAIISADEQQIVFNFRRVE